MAANTDGLVAANLLAKETIIEALSETLKEDPAADLSAVFNKQAHAYALVRSGLDVPAGPLLPENGLGPYLSKVSMDCSGSQAPAGTDGEADDRSFVMINGSIRVHRSIDPCILDLVWPDAKQPQKPLLSFPTADGRCEDEFVAGLNAALKQGDMLWSLHHKGVVGLGPTAVVKVGVSLDDDGITNLDYINTYCPSVPAPIVLGAVVCGDRSYVFMSRGRGVTLEALWPDLMPAEKRDVQDQLNHIFHNLRLGRQHDTGHNRDSNTAASSEAPSYAPHIGSFTSAVCKDTRRDQRVSHCRLLDEDAFNDFLVRAPPPRSTPASIRMLRPVMKDDHAIVMTHADLHPRNIMAELVSDEEPGQTRRCIVTCIIDWEMGGWYPAYWEFVKTMCNAPLRGPLGDWANYLPTDAMGTWPVEYALDSLIGRWLG